MGQLLSIARALGLSASGWLRLVRPTPAARYGMAWFTAAGFNDGTDGVRGTGRAGVMMQQCMLLVQVRRTDATLQALWSLTA